MITQLTLYVAENCSSCQKVEDVLNEFNSHQSSISLRVKDITENRTDKVTIVPALFVADKLFAIGEVDTGKLAEYIKDCESEVSRKFKFS